MKSVGHLCLQNYFFRKISGVIFTNMEYRHMTKALNLEISYKGNTILLRGKHDVLINVTWYCFDQSNFYISRINIIEWTNILCFLHDKSVIFLQIVPIFLAGNCSVILFIFYIFQMSIYFFFINSCDRIKKKIAYPHPLKLNGRTKAYRLSTPEYNPSERGVDSLLVMK